MTHEIRVGHVLDRLRELPDESIDCVVTSPPYWGLRDYGISPQIWGGDSGCNHSFKEHVLPAKNGSESMVGCTKNIHSATRKRTSSWTCTKCSAWLGDLGLEPTFEMFIDHLLLVFGEVKRVLKPSGTAWINMGDSYLKKNLVGQPWQLAFAMKTAGWILRRDIVWEKPSAMPESCKDRPTTAHEYIFLLTKSESYWYDAGAIKEACSTETHARMGRAQSGYAPPGQEPHQGSAMGPRENIRAPGVDPKAVSGWAAEGSKSAIEHNQGERKARLPGKNFRVNVSRSVDGGPPQQRSLGPKGSASDEDNRSAASARLGRGEGWRVKQNESFSAAVVGLVESRNSRSIWRFASEGFPGAHFATFPAELPRRCILAGCPPGGIVLDIFSGSGTTVAVAKELGRSGIGIELNPEYAEMAIRRISDVNPPLDLFEVPA